MIYLYSIDKIMESLQLKSLLIVFDSLLKKEKKLVFLKYLNDSEDKELRKIPNKIDGII